MNSLIFIFCLTLCLFNSAFSDSDESAKETDESEKETARWAQRCRADALQPWSYRGDNGPNYWGETHRECHGFRQSPIHIDSGRLNLTVIPPMRGLYYNNIVANLLIKNNGYTVQAIIEDTLWRWIYTNRTYYNLAEIHFHWGSNDAVGSEHVVDGVRYPMEMHLVHKSQQNGTVVVAIFFEAVDEINAEMQHIVNELPKIMYKDTQVRLRYRFDFLNILPENPISYFQYDGSLTTPNCTEGVIWIVAKTPNHIGRCQLREFRKLFSSPQEVTESACKLSNNFRPLQHLHRRPVFTSQESSNWKIISGSA